MIMERKIGEIFEFGGELYQCVEGTCRNCSFYYDTVCKNITTIGNCYYSSRTDHKFVIFKKLEKVGEPYEFDGHLFQSYRTFEVPIFTENYATVRELGNNSKISIEIKQTNEDMEEKKLNLKPFDIQKAREGKPVCTRDGRKARIICFDRNDLYPIVALIECEDGKEIIGAYSKEGQTEIYEIKGTNLMMLPEKKEGWVNVYNADTTFYYVEGMVYNTKDEAIQKAKEEITTEQREKSEYVDTVKINWEE